MSTPISSIALTANGLTCVASVPALIASKWSPARCLSSPSAIWLLAELWVHRNRTLFLSPKMRLLSIGSTKNPRPELAIASSETGKGGVRRHVGVRSREGQPAAPLSPEGGPDVADAPRRRGGGGMPRGLHHATGHVAAHAGDDELGVGADPAQGRRGEGGLEGQPDEVEPGDRAAHPPALVRAAVGPQGAQGPQVAQVRAVAGG